jgi:hypothetical protein
MMAHVNNQLVSSLPSVESLWTEVKNAPDESVDGETLRHFDSAVLALETFRNHVKLLR